MSTNQEYPLLNGVAPSWADCSGKITATGQPILPMIDVSAYHTGRSLEVGEQRGATGGRVRRRTTGAASYEASVTCYRSGFQPFVRTLMKAAQAAGHVRGPQVSIGKIAFGLNLMWTPDGDTEIYERRVKGCRYLGDTIDTAEGTDADTVECPLSTPEIVDVIDNVEVVLL
jgi:hypothetical protein